MAKVIYPGFFPYCITAYQPSDFLPHVSTVSLEKAMSIFWKVKKFRFFGQYQTTETESLPSETRSWEQVWSSKAGSEKDLVCNPGYSLDSSVNLIEEDQLKSFLEFDNITSYGGGFVVPISVGGWFSDTFGPEGFSAANPSQTSMNGQIVFEGVTLWAGQAAGAAMSYEIIEHWPYQ